LEGKHDNHFTIDVALFVVSEPTEYICMRTKVFCPFFSDHDRLIDQARRVAKKWSEERSQWGRAEKRKDF
jgi:hypothetical protein